MQERDASNPSGGASRRCPNCTCTLLIGNAPIVSIVIAQCDSSSCLWSPYCLCPPFSVRLSLPFPLPLHLPRSSASAPMTASDCAGAHWQSICIGDKSIWDVHRATAKLGGNLRTGTHSTTLGHSTAQHSTALGHSKAQHWGHNTGSQHSTTQHWGHNTGDTTLGHSTALGHSTTLGTHHITGGTPQRNRLWILPFVCVLDW